MKYLLIITTAFVFAFGSLAWNTATVKGNGDVIKKKRDITESFNSVEVSQGIDLFIKQGNEISVTVEADENIYDLLITEVKNNVLHIYFENNIKKAKSKKVFITVMDLTGIRASSGADVLGEMKITGKTLKLKATSGSDIEMELDYESLTVSSSSGSDMKLSGSCNDISLNSSSGSDIEAEDLKAKIVKAESSSGSDIIISVSESLTAEASSGSDILYRGSPREKNIHRSSGGSVRNK